METLITQLIAGAVGGNAAGAGLKNLSLGTLGNTIVGLLGGLGGGSVLAGMLGGAADAAGGGGMGGLLGSLVGGGAGGAILTAVVGLIKSKMAS